MSIITRMLKQTAVYWAPLTPDGLGGWTYDEPVDVDCRWEGESELEITADGQQLMTKAKVFVGQDVEENGWLWLGAVDDLDSSGVDPLTVAGAGRIIKFQAIPNFKATETLRIVRLV